MVIARPSKHCKADVRELVGPHVRLHRPAAWGRRSHSAAGYIVYSLHTDVLLARI